MAPKNQVKATPISYVLIRWLFKFVLKVFYGTIVVENEEYLPKPGEACIFCANHTNSLTDALILMTISKHFLRMTAKSTQFGRGTFTSWLIESSGALPLHRRMDFAENTVLDNADVMGALYRALEEGDSICLFPEGMSRYKPALSPLKTGVARIISEVLTRKRDDPDYELTLLTCSFTYMNRQYFRSDVLVSFNPPIKFKPQECSSLIAPVGFETIKTLTNVMANQISAGTLDAPSWDVIRTAKVAARIYAPLGTNMTLGDYVRVIRTFVEGFKKTGEGWRPTRDRRKSWDELMVPFLGRSAESYNGSNNQLRRRALKTPDDDIDCLAKELTAYEYRLLELGIKDDRVRAGPLPRYVILYRILLRSVWLAILTTFSLPGLLLWSPVFAATKWSSSKFKSSGPQEDVWDEIAQHKVLIGLFSGTCVWLCVTLLTFPIAPTTFFLTPCLMWMSLRFMEDAVSAFRAIVALVTLFWIGSPTIKELLKTREALHQKVMSLAVEDLALPTNPEKYFKERGGREKGRIRSTWESNTKYFSITRRRKRDWNEILRIWPHNEYE